jgi:glycosyltransferase involved in cell wall biosynthesis
MPHGPTSCVRHLIAPEYPPRSGGVGDYVQQLAAALRQAGEEVHVWCPSVNGAPAVSDSVYVHRDLGRFRPDDLRRVGEQLDRFPAPRRILVQWVPHGYGYRSMNLGFCLWLWNRARRGDEQIELMVHEAFLAFEGSWRQYAAALVHRLMTVILLRFAERVWFSIPMYIGLCRPYTLGRRIPFQWLPVPSNVPVIRDPHGVAALHSQYAGSDGLLIGHFGTYGKALNSLLEDIIVRIVDQNADARVLLIGAGGNFLNALVRKYPHLTGKIHTTGLLPTADLSRHFSACDLMIQPFPDGVSTRRTSFMASLNHGKAVVTTSGRATEAFWFDSDAIAITATGDAAAFVSKLNDLWADAGKRTAMGRAARNLYEERFDIRHVVAALRLVSEDVACVS